MILEFSVKNFLSFKEKVTFSMIANSNKELNDNYVEIGGNKVLKSAAVYGANASGKSNLFKILTLVVLMLRSSNSVDINAKLPLIPFKLDKGSVNKPSEFEIKFILDETRYVYGFIADKDKIYDEYLYYYPNGRETKIFDRTNINEYSYTQKDEKILREIETKNAQNKFFKKNCDLLVVNDLFEDGAGFKTDTNKVALITKNFVDYLDLMSKDDLSDLILDKLIKVKGE